MGDDETEAVLNAAYAWRYAWATPGAGLDLAELALVDAVDAWDANRPHDDDGGPS